MRRAASAMVGNRGIGPVSPPAPLFALEFPSNVSGDDQSAPFVAIQFANPQSNGLPIWGPAGVGVTWIWEYRPIQQTGYYVTFWWSNNGTFAWDNGSSNTFYGAHPYPQNQSNTGTTHWWEIALAGDHFTTLAANEKTVVKDGTTYLQALRVTKNGNGSKTLRFYTALPSVAAADVIEWTEGASYGESDPPTPAITFGDSPWYAGFQHERLSGGLARVKIVAKDIGLTDMLSEAANMNALTTAEGLSNIWWGKKGFRTVDDLTCDYGTGRSFAWADAGNKGSLGHAI